MIKRDVPTTNNTEPQRPAYPAVRKPAKGPLITTSNVDKVSVEVNKPIPMPATRGRKPKK